MIDEPRTIIQASPAERFTIAGQQLTTCRTAAERWFNSLGVAQQLNVTSLDQLPVQLTTQQLPPRHSGLGSGTQIALTTATALNRFFELPAPAIEELSVAMGRAQRSAIGSYGFVEGGFLVDQGKTANQPMAALDFQIDFPTDWPVVLMFPDQPSGLAGDQEQAAFDQIPATTEAEHAAMQNIVQTQIVPSLVQRNYEQFAAALFDFGHRSGLYFQSVQGGPYNGAAVQALIDHTRSQAVPATGQTSWGPCVFAITKDAPTAQSLATSVQATFGDTCQVRITTADNSGVKINNVANQLPRVGVINRLNG